MNNRVWCEDCKVWVWVNRLAIHDEQFHMEALGVMDEQGRIVSGKPSND